MEKRILITASILGFLSILLGAFAAHGLQAILNEQQILSFQTGVRYQFYHVFLLLFIANTNYVLQLYKTIIYRLTVLGVLLFSGSIYFLTLDEYLISYNVKMIAILTPIGGLFLLCAWATLLFSLSKKKV